MSNKTTRGGTYTSEGAIPNLLVPFDGGVIHAPVKLDRKEHGQGYRLILGNDTFKLPKPMKRDGRLVFALPGGAEVLG